ncbi:MAG TPA: DUF126 domain-containing protein [Nitrososphaera sp.]|nr:DUF126 domain-containing protein [Nitrososphaera sp.]
MGGEGEGAALVTSQPINFLAMLDAKAGMIADPRHEICGKPLKGSVLVFPFAVGSSVGAYAIYSLSQYGNAPSAIVCSKADITTASGCAIARIPVVDLPENTPLSMLQGSIIAVSADAGKITVKI